MHLWDQTNQFCMDSAVSACRFAWRMSRPGENNLSTGPMQLRNLLPLHTNWMFFFVNLINKNLIFYLVFVSYERKVIKIYLPIQLFWFGRLETVSHFSFVIFVSFRFRFISIIHHQIHFETNRTFSFIDGTVRALIYIFQF